MRLIARTFRCAIYIPVSHNMGQPPVHIGQGIAGLKDVYVALVRFPGKHVYDRIPPSLAVAFIPKVADQGQTHAAAVSARGVRAGNIITAKMPFEDHPRLIHQKVITDIAPPFGHRMKLPNSAHGGRRIAIRASNGMVQDQV